MFRQSPRRSQRNKGFKVKHVLQISLLCAVSIWLIYQVQHSHNKKAPVEESTKVSDGGLNNENDMFKLGRKDLKPHVEGTAVKDVRQKEDQEEDIQERLGEDKKDFVYEESEIEARKDQTDERNDVDAKSEDRNKGSAKETDDIGEEEVKRKQEEERDEGKENGHEGSRGKSSEENLTTVLADGQSNGSRGIEVQEKDSQDIVTMVNQDSKEKGREGIEGKSSKVNDSRDYSESKENKEEEGKSMEVPDKRPEDEKKIESKGIASEKSGETNIGDKIKETREEKEGAAEGEVKSENQVRERNDAEAAREGEMHVSSILDQGSQITFGTEGKIMEKSHMEEQIENTQANHSEEKVKNMEASSVDQNNSTNVDTNNSASNVTEDAIKEKTNADTNNSVSNVTENAIKEKNATTLLGTEDSSNKTIATSETGGKLKVNDNRAYEGGKPASDTSTNTSLNQNEMVDNIVPVQESTQTLLQEQIEKSEDMSGHENSDSNSTIITDKKDSSSGNSMESFDKTESVVSDEQSQQTADPGTSSKTLNSSANSTRNDDGDTLQNRTKSEMPGAEDHLELPNGNAELELNKTGDLPAITVVAEREVSSSSSLNENSGASKHVDEVNSDTSLIAQNQKEGRIDSAPQPKLGTEETKHEVVAAEK